MGSRHLAAAQCPRGWAGRLYAARRSLAFPALACPAVFVSAVTAWLLAKPCPMPTKAWSTQGRRNRKGTGRKWVRVRPPRAWLELWAGTARGPGECRTQRPPPAPQGSVLQALPPLCPLCGTGHAHSPAQGHLPRALWGGHLPSPGLAEHLGQNSTWGLPSRTPSLPHVPRARSRCPRTPEAPAHLPQCP